MTRTCYTDVDPGGRARPAAGRLGLDLRTSNGGTGRTGMAGRSFGRCRYRGRRPAFPLAPAVAGMVLAGMVLAGLVGACGVEIDHEVRPIPPTGGPVIPAPAVAPSGRLVDFPDTAHAATPAPTTTPGPTATPPGTGAPRDATSPRAGGAQPVRPESSRAGQPQG